MKLVLSISIYFFAFNANATFVYDATAACQKAYANILQLKLNEGELKLKKEIVRNPDNLFPVFLANYIDFFKLYISEDKELYAQLIKKRKTRLQLLEKGDRISPFYLFTKASVMLQWAILKLKFGDYLQAFREVNRSYQILKENKQRFPEFSANDMNLALLHTVIGAIPKEFDLGKAILGWKASVSQGLDEMKSVLDKGASFFFYPECRIYYTLLQLHLGNNENEAWRMVNEPTFDTHDNLLNCFVKAHVAMYSKHNDEAAMVLKNAPQSNSYWPFYFLDYMYGLTLIRQLDTGANFYFQRYINRFQGENYIKESWQKLAWMAILNQDSLRYRQMMIQCLHNGTDKIDADKAAQQEAESGEIPNIRLLQSRLLFDGADYQRALDTLKKISNKDSMTLKNQIEYGYRMGRVLQNLGQSRQAVVWLLKTMVRGEKQPWYFAASAALQCGLIYESKLDFVKARYFYLECLAMHENEYKSGLDAQAKAALSRIKSKN